MRYEMRCTNNYMDALLLEILMRYDACELSSKDEFIRSTRVFTCVLFFFSL